MRWQCPIFPDRFQPSIFGDEKLVIATDGTYTCTIGDKTTTGRAKFTSIENQDGTFALYCKLTDEDGTDRHILPIRNIKQSKQELLDCDYTLE